MTSFNNDRDLHVYTMCIIHDKAITITRLRPIQKIYVLPISRPTQHFLADRLRFFYCATQSFFIGDHIEKNEVNRTTLREVMRF